VKTITIRLPDVEAAMLVEVQKVNKMYRDLQDMVLIKEDGGMKKYPVSNA
jgi:hypothetical protein